MSKTTLQRFCQKVRLPLMRNACWEWIGADNGNGYGRMGVNGKLVYAHRYSYETFVGPILVGKQLDHLCRNPNCVNPAHLEPVSQATNIARGENLSVRRRNAANRTHCKNGHERSPENTRIRINGSRIKRTCRICLREWARRVRPWEKVRSWAE